MSNNYYCLVAGLSDILLSDTKLAENMADFKTYLREELSDGDYKLLESYFWRYDNENLLSKLTGKKYEHNTLANISEDDLDELLKVSKTDSLDNLPFRIPSYFEEFIQAFRNEESLHPNLSWENQLSTLYYKTLLSLSNSFIKEWYKTELDITNLIAAYNCKKFGIPAENEVIGSDEVASQLKNSNARDFGLTNDFPELENILKALENENILEKERQLNQIQWNLLDEMVFFHYFSIEKVFAFMVKVTWLERWIKLDKAHGQQMFKSLMSELENSYDIPTEF
jgi:hypothetical protein